MSTASKMYKMIQTQLLHGSDHIIEKPNILFGKPNHDFGQGFYCTRDMSLAMEWACKQNTDGFVNRYFFENDSLKTLNLLDEDHTILHWIALLLKNRIFSLPDDLSVNARDYIIKHFLIDLEEYDVVIGYRADDSCFSFAEAFVQNKLSLRSFNQTLKQGNIGTQIVLISEKAVSQLTFRDIKLSDRTIYYPKLCKRDSDTREICKKQIHDNRFYKDDIYISDIIREEMKGNDSRIQRILSE